MHMIGSYYETLNGIGPGIDVSHYGAPYQGMFGLGTTPWTGAPAEDPRMVRQFTTIRATYRVRNLGGDRTAARAAAAILSKAQALFSGNTVRKIGTTGWTSDGKVGFEVILASAMRAGEIKQKNFMAGQQAAAQMGGNVEFYDAATSIPSNAFEDAPPTAPPTPETTPYVATTEDNFLTQEVGGLPVWALGLIGIGVVGGVAFVVLRKKPAAVAANRRRRRRTTRRNGRRRRRSR